MTEILLKMALNTTTLNLIPTLVRKDMDSNDHERLFSLALRHKFK
jgi:hypothetical protein